MAAPQAEEGQVALLSFLSGGRADDRRRRPTLLAKLVYDLSRELALEDIEKQLPYSLDELKDSLELLKIPDGLDDLLNQEAERQARERPQILTFVVEDAETVERAIEAAK